MLAWKLIQVDGLDMSCGKCGEKFLMIFCSVEKLIEEVKRRRTKSQRISCSYNLD